MTSIFPNRFLILSWLKLVLISIIITILIQCTDQPSVITVSQESEVIQKIGFKYLLQNNHNVKFHVVNSDTAQFYTAKISYDTSESDIRFLGLSNWKVYQREESERAGYRTDTFRFRYWVDAKYLIYDIQSEPYEIQISFHSEGEDSTEICKSVVITPENKFSFLNFLLFGCNYSVPF